MPDDFPETAPDQEVRFSLDEAGEGLSYDEALAQVNLFAVPKPLDHHCFADRRADKLNLSHLLLGSTLEQLKSFVIEELE